MISVSLSNCGRYPVMHAPDLYFACSLQASGVGLETPGMLPAGTYWYGDAMLMKANAGGSFYISWNSNGRWDFHRSSSFVLNGVTQYHNYAFEFCSCTNLTPGVCQRTTPAAYK